MTNETPEQDLDRKTEESGSAERYQEKDFKKQGIEFEKQQEKTITYLAIILLV